LNIQKRLMLVILPLLILLVISILGISTYITTSAMEEQIQANAKLLSASYSDQLNSKLQHYRKMSEDLASAVVTSIHIETTLIEARKRYPEFSHIFYTDLKGNVTDMSPYDAKLEDLSFRGYLQWKEALTTKEPVISEPMVFLGSESIFIFTPVLLDFIADKGPQVSGLVCLILPADSLFVLLQDAYIGVSGSNFILSSTGKYLYHSRNDLLLDIPFSETPSETSLVKLEKAMLEGYRGYGTFFKENGRNFLSFAPIDTTGWTFAIQGGYQEFYRSVNQSITISLMVMLLGLVISSLLLYLIVHNVVRPIEDLTAMVQEIDQGNMHLRSNIQSSSEVGILSQALDSMVDRVEHHQRILEQTVEEKTAELKETNTELSHTVEELNAANANLTKTRDKLWSEMELAHQLQTVLLPSSPSLDGFEVNAFMATADSVGGDYYDVIHVGGYDWFLIGDVSGHGVTAGLVMMMVQTSIHVALSQNPGISPGMLLTVINKTIHENIKMLGGNKYITMTVFACQDKGRFSFAGAHLPLIVYRHKSQTVEITETDGMWVGLVDDIEGMNTDQQFHMDFGDILLLHTDGISEAETREGKMYTQEGLVSLFRAKAELPVEEICLAIQEQMNDLIIDDDVTVFILKRVKKDAKEISNAAS